MGTQNPLKAQIRVRFPVSLPYLQKINKTLGLRDCVATFLEYVGKF
jgi:hypothetical protein